MVEGFEDDGFVVGEVGAVVEDLADDGFVGDGGDRFLGEELGDVACGAVDEFVVGGGDVGHEVAPVATEAAHDECRVGVEEEF